MAGQAAQLTELVHSFVKALTLHKLYGPRHPHVLEACQGVVAALGTAASDSPELTIGIAKDRLFVGQESLLAGGDARIIKFITTFHHLGVSHVRLRAGLSPEELGQFLDTLAREGANGPEAVLQGLRTAGVVDVSLGLLDYTKVTTQQEEGEGEKEGEGPPGQAEEKAARDGVPDKAQDKAAEEAVWRKLVLPAAHSGLGPLSVAERSELLGLVEEPELLRALLERLEGLPRRPSGAAGKAEVADFFRHLNGLLKALSPERREAFISRLSGLIASRRAKGGARGGTSAGAGGARTDQALEVMAAALATEGKASERLRTTYGKVLGEAARGKRAAKADTGAAATAYLEEMFLKRSESAYMSEGYAGELEVQPAAAGNLVEEGEGPEMAGLIETLEARRLCVERSRLAVELLGSASSESDVQALLAVIVQVAGTLLKEGRFEEAAELLESVWRDFYAQEGRSRIERVIADDVLGPLDVTPLLEGLLAGRNRKEARERLAAVCRLFPAKAAPYLLERLREAGGEAELAALLAGVLGAMGKAVLPEVRERLASAEGEYLLRLIALMGAVGGETEAALLAPLLRRWREAVRREAVRALGAIGSPRSVPVLAEVLRGRPWRWGQKEVRLEAAWALNRIGSEEAVQALLAASRGRGEVARACQEMLAHRQRPAAAREAA